ncbi:unnamed protein product [Dimorphilus gyrociliatus]|uniref:Uncharacterized protein n=1 Tax=Dimorphilus gyrociliatus TaxID=2664684 RepID=A0A7I8VXM4_9ANNE|nr:unnamed protein product [Dimorphilus gyrociliatus]
MATTEGINNYSVKGGQGSADVSKQMAEKYISPIVERIRLQDIAGSLDQAHKYSSDYINTIDDRPVYPDQSTIDKLDVFDTNLQNGGEDIESILESLHTYGSPASVAQTGGRYFGFVCGGILPSALASKWLTDVWDQNAALFVMSPVASKLEQVVEKWLVDLLGLPEETVAGFVSGSSTATIIGLTVGRNYLLTKAGYNVFEGGLFNAPPIKVVLGEGSHSTVYKALSIVGFGTANIVKVPVDDQGRMTADQLPRLDGRTLLILQAGHVNSGSFDDFQTICQRAKEVGAYVHVDGAFGLFAMANKRFNHLTKGVDLADSWSVDGHKTLNTPYDCGVILCRHRQQLINSMQMTGSYIIVSENRDNMVYTTEMSRRARAIEMWASLKSLGRDGVGELVWELHKKAVYFGEKLEKEGLEILNSIVFNQILVRHKDDNRTNLLLKSIQNSGVCWLGGAKWNGKSVIRISVSSFRTTYDDIDVSVKDILRLKDELEHNDSI